MWAVKLWQIQCDDVDAVLAGWTKIRQFIRLFEITAPIQVSAALEYIERSK